MASDRILSPVERLIGAQQKIEAIKRLRELSGLGLRDAKDAVEHFIRHGAWRPSDTEAVARAHASEDAESRARNDAFARAVLEDPSLLVQSAVQLNPAAKSGLAASLRTELLRLLEGGKKVRAIKRYREAYGVGLADAKQAVEALAAGRELPIPDPVTAPHHPVPLPDPRQAEPVRSDPREVAARRVLVERFGEPPLASAAAECGLFKGFLFVTERRVAFVADRYGSWEVTEDLPRAEFESAVVKEDPFGFDLVIQAGYHSAHFSELSRETADGFVRLLTGASSRGQDAVTPLPQAAPVEHLAPPSEFSSTAATSAVPHPAVAGPTPAPVALAPAAATPPFRPGHSFAAALLAALPVTLYASSPRFFPMEDFPAVANSALFWSLLGIGAMFRGHAAVMLRTGLVVGLVLWAAAHFLDLFSPARAAAVIAMGAAYGSTRGKALVGAVLALPILFFDRLFALSVSEIVFVPTLGFTFWLFQLLVEDWSKSKDATRAPPSGG